MGPKRAFFASMRALPGFRGGGQAALARALPPKTFPRLPAPGFEGPGGGRAQRAGCALLLAEAIPARSMKFGALLAQR